MQKHLDSHHRKIIIHKKKQNEQPDPVLDLKNEEVNYDNYEQVQTEEISQPEPIKRYKFIELIPKKKLLKSNKRKKTKPIVNTEPIISNISCKECGMKFISHEDLEKHFKFNHKSKDVDIVIPRSAIGSIPKPPPSFRKPKEKIESVCDQCGQVCTSFEGLRSHVRRVHLKTRKHACHICSRKFHASSEKREHIRIVHEKNKDFICEHCGRAFGTANQLENHTLNIHSEDKNFQCHVCKKSYGTKLSLNNHLRFHEEPKYNCETCGRKFKTSEHKKKHVLVVHEGIRKYECDNCGKKFSTSNNLKQHQSSVHEGKQLYNYPCTYCDKSFNRNHLLQIHVSKFHAEPS